MKSVRWRRLLKLNQKMMEFKMSELKSTTDMSTHVIKGSHSVAANSVSVYASLKEERWFD